MGLYLVNYTLKYSLMGLNGTIQFDGTIPGKLHTEDWMRLNGTLPGKLHTEDWMRLNGSLPGKLHTEVQFDGTLDQVREETG